MNTNEHPEQTRFGKVSWGLAAWLLGLPLPIILLALLFGGCTKW